MIRFMSPVLAVLAAVTPAAAQWKNEPPGFGLIADNRGSTINGGCWFSGGGAGLTIGQDGQAPLSPSDVLSFHYYQGLAAGVGPGAMHCSLGGERRETYAGFWWKATPNFNTEPLSQVTKQAFFISNAGFDIFWGMKGTSDPRRLYIALETVPAYGACNSHTGSGRADEPCGSRGFDYNVGNVPIITGQWYKVEVYSKFSDTKISQNGILKMWINDTLVIDYRNINYATDWPWVQFNISPTWGGNISVKQQSGDYYFFDHVRVSAAGAGGGTVPPPPPPPPTTPPPPPPAAVGTVNDLSAAALSASTVELRFTEVSDGSGQPAKYEIRHGSGTANHWGAMTPATQGTCASPLAGSSVGAARTCTVTGLAPATQHHFQMAAFRGTLNVDAAFGQLSNQASASTPGASSATDINGDGSTNVTDVQLAVNQSLGISPCGTADVTGDGQCGITDVQRIINAALNL